MQRPIRRPRIRQDDALNERDETNAQEEIVLFQGNAMDTSVSILQDFPVAHSDDCSVNHDSVAIRLPPLADVEFQQRLSAQAELISGLQRSVLEFKQRIENLDSNSQAFLAARSTGDAGALLNGICMSDIVRLGIEWQQWVHEFKEHSLKCQREKESYVSHLRNDHGRFLELWRMVQQLRREFSNARSLTFRNLSSFGGELRRVSKETFVACHRLNMKYLRTVVSKGITKRSKSKVEAVDSEVLICADSSSEDSKQQATASNNISSGPSSLERHLTHFLMRLIDLPQSPDVYFMNMTYCLSISMLQFDNEGLEVAMAEKNTMLQRLSSEVESGEQFLSGCLALAEEILQRDVETREENKCPAEQLEGDSKFKVMLALQSALKMAQERKQASQISESQLKSANDDAAAARQELDLTVEKYAELKRDFAVLQEKMTALEDENEAIVNELKKCKSDQEVDNEQLKRLKTMEADYERLKIISQKKQFELERALHERSTADDRIKVIIEENKHFREDLSQRCRTCENLTRDVATIAQEKEGLQVEIQRLKREIASANDSRESLQLELNNSERRFTMLVEDFEKFRETEVDGGMEHEVQAIARQRDSLLKLINELKSNIQQLTKEKSSNKKSRELLEKLLSESRNENLRQSATISSLNQQLESTGKIQDQLEVQHRKAEDELRELRKKLSCCQQANAAGDERLKCVSNELEHCRLDFIAARENQSETIREKNSYYNELLKTKAETSALRQEVERRVMEKAELEATVQRLQLSCKVTMEENAVIKQSLDEIKDGKSEEKTIRSMQIKACIVPQ
ncbi:unnamed protein product [Soboliphyme baturini]|uniref:Rootletin n=1 Tax=Soboliphyme baturini TaxID=241478 RepID=A0A183ID36_9BILA|nr:unnamed protein product [Soboliphyme baturini]